MTLVLGLGALFGALVLGLLGTVGLRAERSTSRRLVTLIEAHGDTPAASRAAVRRGGAALLTAMLSIGRRLALALTRPSSLAALQRRLDLAGNPARWTAERVLAAKGCGLLAGGALGFLFGADASLLAVVPLTGAGGAAGFFLPDLLLYNIGTKRQEQIQRGLSDGLDLLVISVQAGLGFDAALAQVARNSGGPLAAEFGRVLQEMQLGKSRREAFAALGERTTATDVRHFVSAVTQADALGIPISGVLRAQAGEMRTKRRQAAEEKAQKVPVKILIPLMVLILPCLFIIVMGPVALKAMNAF